MESLCNGHCNVDGTGFNFSRAVMILHIVYLFLNDFYNSINSLSLNLSITVVFVCMYVCVRVLKVARNVSEAR